MGWGQRVAVCWEPGWLGGATAGSKGGSWGKSGMEFGNGVGTGEPLRAGARDTRPGRGPTHMGQPRRPTGKPHSRYGNPTSRSNSTPTACTAPEPMGSLEPHKLCDLEVPVLPGSLVPGERTVGAGDGLQERRGAEPRPRRLTQPVPAGGSETPAGPNPGGGRGPRGGGRSQKSSPRARGPATWATFW